jgi:hypothetical protein
MPSLAPDDTSPDRLSPEEIQALRDEFAESPTGLDDLLEKSKELTTGRGLPFGR